MTRLKINRNITVENIFSIFLSIEFLLFFLNSDRFFQISGFALPLIISLGFGLLWVGKRMFSSHTVDKFTMITICLYFNVCLSALTNISYFDSGYFFSYMVLITFVLVFCNIKLNSSQFNMILGSYIISAITISMIILLLQSRYYAEEITRLTIKIGDNPLIDPNYLGAYMVGPQILCLKKFIDKKNKKILFFVFELIIVVGIFLTGSRGAILASIIGSLFLVINLGSTKLKRKKIFIVFFGIMIALVIFILVIPKETIIRFFSIRTWNDSSNSRRLFLWKNAVIAISSSPFLGLGVGGTASIFGKITGFYEPSHNTFLEIWAQLGVFGILLFLLLFGIVFVSKKSKITNALLVATIVTSFFISSEATMYFWANLAFAYNYDKYIEEQVCYDVLQRQKSFD